ncbi:MAG: hypothetical protein DWP98_08660 [Bacteroidetes bacterium]|nr:MAG: hypothetical protein DWP98_08660 [Bacteroidota bacterium]MBL1146015.1 hypothetical protein [Bacteroidota bacterium]MCB0802213.1 hypothetical protein [Flavobacteriales bacterium]NOG58809.1 hypothetical protein [Bacteroidota bacterium]
MKKILFIVFAFFLCTSAVNSQDALLDKLRPEYMKALHDIDLAPAVYLKFEAIENPSAKILAYKGALEAIMTRTTWNVFKKIGYLNKSQLSFNKAVELEPNNVEVRFMRLSVEHEIPSYLGYSTHMEEDKAFVVKHIAKFNPMNLDQQIMKEILVFVQKSGRFSQAEILLFENVFASL